jgi:hypothetical protein
VFVTDAKDFMEVSVIAQENALSTIGSYIYYVHVCERETNDNSAREIEENVTPEDATVPVWNL